MWNKRLSLASLFALVAISLSTNSSTSAQGGGPSTLPRVEIEHLEYLGGFRLPRENAFSFSEGRIAFRPDTGTLYVGTRSVERNKVAEVSIPLPVITSNPNEMNFAQMVQPFSDPMDGRLSEVTPTDVSLSSLLVYNGRLHGTVSSFYDAGNAQRLSHFSRSLQLNQLNSFSGWSELTHEAGWAGWTSGYLATVPAASL